MSGLVPIENRSIPPGIRLPQHLPPIRNALIRQRVFTHSGNVTKAKQAGALEMEGNDHLTDNEQLEHVGDALIGQVVTVLIHDLFPKMSVGAATKLKAYLVRDTLFAQISRRYQLDRELICRAEQRPVLLSNTKPIANLFEAYVAGLFYSHLSPDEDVLPTPPHTPHHDPYDDGMSRPRHAPSPLKPTRGDAMNHIEEWLRPLFEPLAGWYFCEMQEAQNALAASTSNTAEGEQGMRDDQARGALAMMNQHFIGVERTTPAWRCTQEGLQWRMQLTVSRADGTVLTAEAVRDGKKAAQTIAAYKICQQMNILP